MRIYASGKWLTAHNAAVLGGDQFPWHSPSPFDCRQIPRGGGEAIEPHLGPRRWASSEDRVQRPSPRRIKHVMMVVQRGTRTEAVHGRVKWPDRYRWPSPMTASYQLRFGRAAMS